MGGDLAVTDDRIVAMGGLSLNEEQFAKSRPTASRWRPGSSDTHTHDDRALLSDPLMECKISQGVAAGDYWQLRYQPGPAV